MTRSLRNGFMNYKVLSSSIQSCFSTSSMSSMGKFKKKKIPDRWEKYSNVGVVVEGTQFIAFKVPLSFHYEWNLTELSRAVPSLSTVVDLTNTNRYYTSGDCHQHGWNHVKIKMQGHGTIPDRSKVERFYSAVSEAEAKGGLIGVHCTHGLNRTGYLICRYLIEKKDWEPQRAIEAFDQSRGHKQERENYLEDLKSKGWERSTLSGNEVSHPESPIQGNDRRHDSTAASDLSLRPHYQDNRGQYGGYRGQPDGYRGQHDGTRGQRGGFKDGHYGYREQHGGYRGQYDGYRGQHDGYRGQHDGYRGQHDGYRGQHDGYRGQHGGYRGQYDGFKGQHGGYRGPHDGYREQQDVSESPQHYSSNRPDHQECPPNKFHTRTFYRGGNNHYVRRERYPEPRDRRVEGRGRGFERRGGGGKWEDRRS